MPPGILDRLINKAMDALEPVELPTPPPPPPPPSLPAGTPIPVLMHVDMVLCQHGGWVNLFAGRKKDWVLAHGADVITEGELLASPIQGCANKPPCVKVASIVKGLAKQVLAKPGGPNTMILRTLVALSNAGAAVTWVSPGSAPALRAMLKHHEAYRADVYYDTATPPHPTTGVGFNLDAPAVRARLEKLGVDVDKDLIAKVGKKVAVLDPKVGDAMLDHELDNASRVAQHAVGADVYANLTPERQAALTDLAYNFGHIPKEIIAPIQKGDFAAASETMRTTYPKWYAANTSNARGPRVVGWLHGVGLVAAEQ